MFFFNKTLGANITIDIINNVRHIWKLSTLTPNSLKFKYLEIKGSIRVNKYMVVTKSIYLFFDNILKPSSGFF